MGAPPPARPGPGGRAGGWPPAGRGGVGSEKQLCSTTCTTRRFGGGVCVGQQGAASVQPSRARALHAPQAMAIAAFLLVQRILLVHTARAAERDRRKGEQQQTRKQPSRCAAPASPAPLGSSSMVIRARPGGQAAPCCPSSPGRTTPRVPTRASGSSSASAAQCKMNRTWVMMMMNMYITTAAGRSPRSKRRVRSSSRRPKRESPAPSWTCLPPALVTPPRFRPAVPCGALRGGDDRHPPPW